VLLLLPLVLQRLLAQDLSCVAALMLQLLLQGLRSLALCILAGLLQSRRILPARPSAVRLLLFAVEKVFFDCGVYFCYCCCCRPSLFVGFVAAAAAIGC
jgi:hypothetical protein